MSAHSYIIRSYKPFVVEYHDFNSYNIKTETYKYPLTHAEIRAELPFVDFNDSKESFNDIEESLLDDYFEDLQD